MVIDGHWHAFTIQCQQAPTLVVSTQKSGSFDGGCHIASLSGAPWLSAGPSAAPAALAPRRHVFVPPLKSRPAMAVIRQRIHDLWQGNPERTHVTLRLVWVSQNREICWNGTGLRHFNVRSKTKPRPLSAWVHPAACQTHHVENFSGPIWRLSGWKLCFCSGKLSM